MIQDIHVTKLVVALGYEDLTAFQNATQLTLKPINFRDNGMYLDHHNNDFYSSYNKSTYLYFNDDLTDFPSKGVVSEVKKKVADKVRRRKVLEEIRQTGLRNMRNFLFESFDIDPKLVDDEDIKCLNQYYFDVAGVQFYFTGTLKDKSCIIARSKYTTYQEMHNITVRLLKFKFKKQEEYDSKH